MILIASINDLSMIKQMLFEKEVQIQSHFENLTPHDTQFPYLLITRRFLTIFPVESINTRWYLPSKPGADLNNDGSRPFTVA